MNENIMTTYSFRLRGEKPMPLIKGKRDTLVEETNGAHPLIKAKKYELVSIPETLTSNQFVEMFLDSPKSEVDTIYIAIMGLNTKTILEEVTKLTGRCTTNDIVHKGARKWEKLYVLYLSYVDGHDVTQQREMASFDKKGDALAEAKRLAVENEADVEIRLENRLVGSSPIVATLSPEIKTFNQSKEIPYNHFLIFGKGEHGPIEEEEEHDDNHDSIEGSDDSESDGTSDEGHRIEFGEVQFSS